MHRAIPVVAATAGGIALLAHFHTSHASLNLATGPASPTTTSAAPAAPEPTQSSTAPSASSSTTTTSAPPGANHTVDGPVVSTDYGPVQVRVTMQGSRIVDVQALQLPSDRSRSVRISQEAGPMLRQEALQAQSANIDLLSGATYTSEGYAQSLQSALDQSNK